MDSALSEKGMKRFAIIKVKAFHAPFIQNTDAQTKEALLADMGDWRTVVPEGPIMVIDFENRRVLRLTIDNDENLTFTDNADVAFGELTPPEVFYGHGKEVDIQ